jgi:hypothetical protein
MSVVERLFQEARTLPLAEQAHLVTLLAQTVQAAVEAEEARRQTIRRIKGSMAGLLPSTEQLQAEKRAELELEERKYQERFGKLAGRL